jgi:hypothetical protein
MMSAKSIPFPNKTSLKKNRLPKPIVFRFFPLRKIPEALLVSPSRIIHHYPQI